MELTGEHYHAIIFYDFKVTQNQELQPLQLGHGNEAHSYRISLRLKLSPE